MAEGRGYPTHRVIDRGYSIIGVRIDAAEKCPAPDRTPHDISSHNKLDKKGSDADPWVYFNLETGELSQV
ncbi:MAG: hypothetical protein ABR999_04005 [Methanoregula sp.]|uniref:hypothetical protein n=1 Tax=Methanoregula sp. TaxID=2052170 RepID=UPI003D150204